VEEAKESLETEKAALQSTRDSLRTTEQDLKLRRQQADSLLSALLAEGQAFETMLEESEQLQEELAAELAEAEDAYEDAKYQQELQNRVPTGVNAGTGNTVGGATWLVPISYTYFSSPFGNRYHPISGIWKMHNGVDLAAPEGTPIYATRSGTVTVATYNSVYGYYVQINHGDGFSSLYGHMTHYIVKVGQKVSAGQVIGYMGSTGWSTGSHLHFTIYYNGNTVNPMNYI
jgi:murein DD-endopeptidase MepM/ murein hydrolase activator NlpD